MTLAISGLAIGLAGAFVLTRLIRKPAVWGTSDGPSNSRGNSVLLAFIALLASYIPAPRAARIDPMVSLRCD